MCVTITKTSVMTFDFYQAIMAEGKQHAICVGITKMSTEDM